MAGACGLVSEHGPFLTCVKHFDWTANASPLAREPGNLFQRHPRLSEILSARYVAKYPR
jgi:hypothetical protein